MKNEKKIFKILRFSNGKSFSNFRFVQCAPLRAEKFVHEVTNFFIYLPKPHPTPTFKNLNLRFGVFLQIPAYTEGGNFALDFQNDRI